MYFRQFGCILDNLGVFWTTWVYSLTALLKGQHDDDDGRPKCDVIEAFSRVTKEDDPRLSKKGFSIFFVPPCPAAHWDKLAKNVQK